MHGHYCTAALPLFGVVRVHYHESNLEESAQLTLIKVLQGHGDPFRLLALLVNLLYIGTPTGLCELRLFAKHAPA